MALPFDLDAEVVRLVSQKLIELPTYPGVALKLQRLFQDPEWSLPALTALVQSDQALSTYVVRTANSAAYPSAAPVTTLAQAISRIGARELTNIAIAGTLGLKGEAPGALAALRKESWRASLVSSLVCQDLAPGRRLDPGEAFLAGLLHGFGETLAYGCFESILLVHPETAPQPVETWHLHGQRHKVELGMVIATQWKLPGFVEEAVRRHADADVSGCQHPGLVKLVAVSDRLATQVLEATAAEQVALDGLPLSEAEQQRLRALIPRLPDILQSFEAGTAPPAPAPAPAAPRPSLVTPPGSPLGPAEQPVSFEVKLGKKGGPGASYRATAWSHHGLRVTGPGAQPERHLVHLDLGGGFALLASVLTCAPAPGGFVLELKPFAMDRTLSARWAELPRRPAAP